MLMIIISEIYYIQVSHLGKMVQLVIHYLNSTQKTTNHQDQPIDQQYYQTVWSGRLESLIDEEELYDFDGMPLFAILNRIYVILNCRDNRNPISHHRLMEIQDIVVINDRRFQLAHGGWTEIIRTRLHPKDESNFVDTLQEISIEDLRQSLTSLTNE